FPVGINASGQISGNYGDANNVVHGFLLSHGQYTTFDDPNALIAAVEGTNGFGLNAGGHLVVEYIDARYVLHGCLSTSPLDANNVFHSFLLSGGQYTTLDDPNAGTGAFQGSFALGINDSGKIVGFYYDALSVIHGYLATPARGDSAVDAARPANLDSASGTVNVLVAAAALHRATPLGNLAVCPTSTSGTNHGDSLSGASTGQTAAVVTVPSSRWGTDASLSGHMYVVSVALGAVRKHPGVTVDDLFTRSEDLIEPIRPI